MSLYVLLIVYIVYDSGVKAAELRVRAYLVDNWQLTIDSWQVTVDNWQLTVLEGSSVASAERTIDSWQLTAEQVNLNLNLNVDLNDYYDFTQITQITQIWTKTLKTPSEMSESVVFDTWLVDCQLWPLENKLSRPHQTVNQFLTKVMNFRQPIGKNTVPLKKNGTRMFT